MECVSMFLSAVLHMVFVAAPGTTAGGFAGGGWALEQHAVAGLVAGV